MSAEMAAMITSAGAALADFHREADAFGVDGALAYRLAGRPGAARTGPPPAAPTVIGGDLNMPRPGTLAAPGYRDVVRGRTFPADRPLIQLDHLLIRGRITAAGAEVLDPVGSDHLPVRAQLIVG